jgi:hypothetical protein
MLKVNLRDGNFAHHPTNQSMSYGHYPSYFQWERDNVLVSDTVFITDLFLHEVDKYKHSKCKVALLIEPPDINPQIYDYVDKNNKKFDYILTFDKKLLDTGRNFLFYPFGCCWVQDYTTPTKSKMCSMIASNKRMTKGHAFRQEIIQRFSSRVDHFGNGFRKIETKEEGLRDYYFSIVLENSQPNYYFSEKLLDCFASRTVPLYWGSDVSHFFNTEGMLIFNTPDELEDIFSKLSPDLYHSLSGPIEENFKKLQKYKIPEDWIYQHYPFLFTKKANVN